jgi:hypothetical protein
MRKFLLICVCLPLFAGFLRLPRLEALNPPDLERIPPYSPPAAPRNGPIDINLIIDGSQYTQKLGGEIAEWLCDYVVDGMLQEGDYLRVWVAGDTAQALYGKVVTGGETEAIKALLRRPLPGSKMADFAGALREARSAPQGEGRPPLMTYTLLVSTAKGLSPAQLGAASSYLRFSRVMDFSGWRALVIALNIGPQVQDAAESFLSGS